MGHKAVERAHIISNALGLVTDKEHTALISAVVVQEVLQRSQESWRWGVSWPAIEYDNDQLRAIIKSDTLTTSGEVDKKKLIIDHSMVVWLLKQIVLHFWQGENDQ